MSFSAMFGKVVLFGGILLLSSAFAVVDPPYEVGTWSNFAKGAISHTFDDYPNQVSNQVGSGQAAFDEKGLHMTLFVQVGSVSNWEPLKKAFAKGHEIGSHNMSHDVNTGTFKQAQDVVKKNVPGEMCATLAYPNCNCSSDAATLGVYIAARNCAGAQNSKTPGNWAQIGSELVGNHAGYQNSASAFNGMADKAASSNGWAVLGHHGIGSDNHSWAVTDLNAMKQHLDYLDKNRDKIWCETFGNVARYIHERDAASVTKKDSSDKGITISVTDNLPDSIYNYPLSIRRPLPEGWTEPAVTQDGKAIPDSILTVDSKKYIMFQAVPDGGDVLISTGAVGTNGKTMHTNNSKGLPVTMQHATLTINRQWFTGTDIALTFFNLNGKIIGRRTLDAGLSSVNLKDIKIGLSAFIMTASDGTVAYSDIFLLHR